MRLVLALVAGLFGGFLALPSSAACVPKVTPDIGSPFVTRNVTKLDTQTSDGVKFTGGCIDGTEIGQNTPAAGTFTTLTATRTTTLDTYVSKTGADTGTCQVSTSPCLTIGYALDQGMSHHLNGKNLVVNFQGSGTWAEDVFINGPPNGGMNRVPIPNIGSTWASQVLLVGNGSTNTTISGTNATCATIAASNYAIVGVKNLKLTSSGASCKSTLFVQMGGMINVYGGNDFGNSGSSGSVFHAENSGSSIQIWEAYTVSSGGSFAALMAASTNALILVNAGVGTITNAPHYDAATVYAAQNATVQFNIAAPLSGSVAASTRRFEAIANGAIETNGDTSATFIPGTLPGFVAAGGSYHGPVAPTIATSTGTGAAGTTVFATGATPMSGNITITAGVGASGTGVVTTAAMPYLGYTPDGGAFVPCFFSGSSDWLAASTFSWAPVTTTTWAVSWANGPVGTGLTNTTVYTIRYTCPAG